MGFTCLDWAARKGRFEIAKFLATDPRTTALTTMGAPVGWACYTNHVDLAKMLVACGASASATNDCLFHRIPPMLLAAENGSLLAMKWLVEDLGHDIHMTHQGQGVLQVRVLP